MSAYDHFHHCYLQQPTVIPCQHQAAFFVSTAQPHQKLLFLFCAVTASVCKLSVSPSIHHIPVWHWHMPTKRFLFISMLHLPPTNALWSKTNHLSLKCVISTVICFCLFIYRKSLFNTTLTMRQQKNLPDNWPNLSEVFAADHCVMEQFVC